MHKATHLHYPILVQSLPLMESQRVRDARVRQLSMDGTVIADNGLEIVNFLIGNYNVILENSYTSHG